MTSSGLRPIATTAGGLLLGCLVFSSQPPSARGATALDGPLPPEPQVVSVLRTGGTDGLPSCREALGITEPLSPPAAPSAVSTGPPPKPSVPDPVGSTETIETPLRPALEADLPLVEGLGPLPGSNPDALPLQHLVGSRDVLAGIRQVFRRGDQGKRVRVSFYGASHTASDWWSGHIRRILQDRWGDLGHGFILPAALYKGYRNADVNLCRTPGWTADYIGKRDRAPAAPLGFSGMSVSSSDPADFGWVETTHVNPHGRKVEWFDIYALGHRDGGSYRVEVDDAPPHIVSTSQPEQGLHITRLAVADGGHRLKVSPVGDGLVTFFGISMERSGPGALVDTMGIRGRQARDWLEWNDQLLIEGWRALNPDIVVLAYGTNEANNSNYSVDTYQAELDAVLSKFRTGLPEVPCILVGPSDRGVQRRGVYSVWDRTAPIAQIQRETAPRYGCAFYDLQEATGGRGSMIAWRFTQPALAASDLIHFTKTGYEWLAERFIKALDSL